MAITGPTLAFLLSVVFVDGFKKNNFYIILSIPYVAHVSVSRAWRQNVRWVRSIASTITKIYMLFTVVNWFDF